MEANPDLEIVRGDNQTVSVEECRDVFRELCESRCGRLEEAKAAQGMAEETQQQLDDGRTVESVRSSLSNFRQSASRTTGQIRELLETSKALDRDLVSFLQDPQTRAFLEGIEEDDDDDNNLMDIGDEASSDNPKEVEALKQKTKSLKRKLRKWRKAARMALSEICPDIGADAQGDMTPGTMKNVLSKIRQLKSLTDRQTSIILSLTGQCDAQKTESEEKDALIMELLRNCNGIRPALVKGEQQIEKNAASGASMLEGMVTKRETTEYPLISASEVAEVLNQTGIQFGSAHLIPKQLQHDPRPSSEQALRAGTAVTVSGTMPRGIDVISTERTHAEAKSTENSAPFPERPSRSNPGMRHLTMSKRNAWWGLATGTAAAFGTILMSNLSRRQNN